jgi:renalase
MTTDLSIAVVGAGIAGARCAQVLGDHRVSVRVFERGRTPGGRMASPVIHGRNVDIGASYFTVSDEKFGAEVERWAAADLVRIWADTFDVFTAAGHSGEAAGPHRWAAPQGLQSIVTRICAGREVVTGREVGGLAHDGRSLVFDGSRVDAVVLAMPDPQARHLLPPLGPLATIRADLTVNYEPVIAVTSGWDTRRWPFEHGAFVNEHPTITFVADDGDRRGDGAAVLVGHTTSAVAATQLWNPDGAIEPVLSSYSELFGLSGRPQWVRADGWNSAKPTSSHERRFAWYDVGIGLAGDAWCPQGSPRVEGAWLSGTAMAEHVLGWFGAGH